MEAVTCSHLTADIGRGGGIRAERTTLTTLIPMSEPSDVGQTADEQYGRQPDLGAVLDVIADRARRQATRRANTLPMLATLGANALAIELRMRAEDHEAIAAAAGVQYTSQLRKIAEMLPRAAREGVEFIVRADATLADALEKAAKNVNGCTTDHGETTNEPVDGTK